MSQFPDEDEEFELMYGDDLDLLREQDENFGPGPSSKTRKCLDFGTATASENHEAIQNVEESTFINDSFEQISNLQATNLQLPNSSLPEFSQQNVNSQEVSNKKKRSINDLFGDIDDLLFEDQIEAKRKKMDRESQDLALIEQIVELRKKAKEKQMLKTLGCTNDSNVDELERNKRNISYRLPKYSFIGLKNHNNDRVYIRFHSEDYEKEETRRLIQESSFSGVMGESFKKIWDEAREIINKELDKANNPENTQIITEFEDNSQLWVDLYKPKKYLELLSDESTNRTMLRWMKLWDKVVFGRKPKVKKTNKDDNKKPFFKKQELSTKLDEHGRPEHKVALLCGPPGLGKTTLAHLVAKHAGYNVVEINASDDRNLNSFKTALENATQMRSVIDNKGRPNCLVFDEIDGAPQASIDFLVKFVNNATNKSKKGTKENKKPNILKRPIVCICNDVYVSALRPLRQIAFVVNFPQTSSTRLAERLMEIAKRQQIKTDLGAMMALAEKSNNDIRSCLSILHFYKAQNKPVTLSEVYRVSIGQKDMQKGLFSVWNDIFQIERPKAKPGDSNFHTVTLSSRMSKILEVVSSFGDYDRLSQGVFENYLNMNVKDSTFETTSDALKWFEFFDETSKKIHETQNYSLSPYLQYAFVVWHFAFSSYQKQKIQYPTQGYEAKTKENRQKSLIVEMTRGMRPTIRCYCQQLSLLLDLCPFLTKIITPSFRPVSLHLYTKDEKETLLRVAGVMIDYNLNYVQERTTEGSYVYNLDPDIEELAVFDKEQPRRCLAYPIKQMIAREIELEKMRRAEPANTTESNGKSEKEKEKAKDPALPNHLQTLKAKSTKKIEPAVRRDFFGRVITSPTAASANSTASDANASDIWYQYKEGYNNAVRKRIQISSLK